MHRMIAPNGRALPSIVLKSGTAISICGKLPCLVLICKSAITGLCFSNADFNARRVSEESNVDLFSVFIRILPKGSVKEISL